MSRSVGGGNDKRLKETKVTMLNSSFYSPSYLIQDDICFLCICDRSYPRKLAFTYLADLASEFTTTYAQSQYLSPTLRPYAFVEFDTFIQRTKKLYQDSRASQNLDKLNDELRDVTKVMTKNIEDLLYRGDSLERMGELSGRLREDSKKYRKAAVRINWELLIKQVSVINNDPPTPVTVDHQPANSYSHGTVRTFRRCWFRDPPPTLVALLLISSAPNGSASSIPIPPIVCMNVCSYTNPNYSLDRPRPFFQFSQIKS